MNTKRSFLYIGLPVGVALILLLAFFILVPIGVAAESKVEPTAASTVVINEFVPKGSEWVELYNGTGASVDITGWYLDDTDCGSGSSVIGSVNLADDGYFVVNDSDAGDNFGLDNSGDVVVLCDSSHTEIDRVGYGDEGAAPLAVFSPAYSAGRVIDGNDTDDDAVDWNVTITSTKGTANDVPGVDLGSSVVFNEFDNYPSSGNDKVEIFNPTTEAITLTGWLISDGDEMRSITTSIKINPSSWIVLEENVDWESMDISSSDVGYLFTPEGVRVDQIGWAGEYENNSFQCQ